MKAKLFAYMNGGFTKTDVKKKQMTSWTKSIQLCVFVYSVYNYM